MITTSKSSVDLGQRPLERVFAARPHQQHRLGAGQVDVGGQQRHALRRRHQRGGRLDIAEQHLVDRHRAACRGPGRARTSDSPADRGRRAIPAGPSPPSPHPTTRPSSSWRPHPFDWRPQVLASQPFIQARRHGHAAARRACTNRAGVSRLRSIGCSCCVMAKPSGRGAASTPAAPTSTSPSTAASRPKLAARGARPTWSCDNPLVISSPRQRALVTAELAGLTVDEVSPLLTEWDYGDYEGLTTPEIRETVPGWLVWTHGCPGGESVAAGQRACRPCGRIGAATHGVARRGVRRPRSLLARGDHPLDRAAVVRGHPVRDGRGVDRGVRLRARRPPAQRTRADRLPASHRLSRDPRADLRARRPAAAPSSPTACTPRTRDRRRAGRARVRRRADHLGRVAI